jgi:hypothetical protein
MDNNMRKTTNQIKHKTVEDSLLDLLNSRARPEDIAAVLLHWKVFPTHTETHRELHNAARYASQNYLMSSEFEKTTAENFRKAAGYFFPTLVFPSSRDVDGLKDFIDQASRLIHRTPGADYKTGRMNRDEREKLGFDMRRSQYNRRFRLLCRLEEKISVLGAEDEAVMAKSRLASQLPRELFLGDLQTAGYIVYFTARSNMRSMFTCGKQDRVYDGVCEAMLEHLQQRRSTNWLAISYVDPSREIVARLNKFEQLAIFSAYVTAMESIAKRLESMFDDLKVNPKTMVVKKGQNSSGWNASAGAWNKLRQGWMSLVGEIGMDDLTKTHLPGKVMRLMAADVMYWHSTVGDTVEPNTLVWADLPRPWDVLLNGKSCSKALVVKTCKKFKLDPETTGWVAAPARGNPATFKPTPNMLHGVTVPNSPTLMRMLKCVGAYSGKVGSGKDVSIDTSMAAFCIALQHQERLEEQLIPSGSSR